MKTLFAIAYTLFGILIGGLGLYAYQKTQPLLVHKLESPLALSGGTANTPPSTLPAGTALYYDRAFPEGFVRYKIYVNVEGIKLESHPATGAFPIDPLTAFPLGRDEARASGISHQLTKQELSSLLRASRLSKQDIKDVLVELSQ